MKKSFMEGKGGIMHDSAPDENISAPLPLLMESVPNEKNLGHASVTVAKIYILI